MGRVWIQECTNFCRGDGAWERFWGSGFIFCETVEKVTSVVSVPDSWRRLVIRNSCSNWSLLESLTSVTWTESSK